MKIIKVYHKGNYYDCFIDDKDYDLVSQRKWYATTENDEKLRVKTTINKKKIRLHHFLLGNEPGTVIDHIDGNTLNNQRSNLRRCSHAENMRNRKQKGRNNTSGYKGVYYYSAQKHIHMKKRWAARIDKDNKVIFLGYFDTAEAAARAYDNAAIEYHGEFAKLNFSK